MQHNEYNTPINMRPYFRNIGLIKVYDRDNNTYLVGEIVFERFDDRNYEYIIKPYWNCIDSLPKGLFQGIPGINMDLRKEAYYRVNMTPSFISMRTPSQSREDVSNLMKSVGLDYYDRFEWLLRSEIKCGDDNLLVVRKSSKPQTIKGFENIAEYNLSPDDILSIDSLSDFQATNASIVRKIYQLLQSWVNIYIESENRYLQDNERKAMLYLLRNILVIMDRNIKTNRENGREQAKALKHYRGRKPIKVDYHQLKQILYEFENNLISEQEAMHRLSINSRSTFYRKLKLVRNNCL